MSDPQPDANINLAPTNEEVLAACEKIISSENHVPPSAYPVGAGTGDGCADQRDPGDENPESAVEMPGNDVEPPMGPIPADEVLFDMNETQAVGLYLAHGLSGAQSHDDMIEKLQAKRDGEPVSYAELTETTLAAEMRQEAKALISAIEGEAKSAISEVETVAAAVETEAKKVWNNALQAWV